MASEAQDVLTEAQIKARELVAARKVEKSRALRVFAADQVNQNLAWKRTAPAELIKQQQENVDNPSDINDPDLMPVVGNSYPPSTTQKLQQMKIADLRTETHHVGKALWVRRIGLLNVTHDGVFFLVEDSKKNVELVHWTTTNLMTDTTSIVPSHQALLIKEPQYVYRTKNQLVIKVEHATDIEFHDGNEEYVLTDLFPYGTLSLQLLDAGKHLRYTTYHLKAVGILTSALKQTPAEDLSTKRELWIERAIAYAYMGKFAESSADLSNGITISQDADAHAQTTYACFECSAAKYELGDYDGAAADMAQAGPIPQGNRLIFALRDKIEARQREAKNGDYDFGAILSKWSVNTPYLDIADYISSKVAASPNPRNGRGLVATKPILPGELIICEKAIASIFPLLEPSKEIEHYDARNDKTRTVQSGLTFKVIDHLLKRPHKVNDLREVLNSLENGLIGDSKTLNTFKIRDLLANHVSLMPAPYEHQNHTLSGFADDDHDLDASDASLPGLWPQCARLSHSCVPNAVKAHVGDAAIVRAYRAIAAGETLSITHIDLRQPLAVRAAELLARYNVTCGCERCATELEDQTQGRGSARIATRMRDYGALLNLVADYPLARGDGAPPAGVFMAAQAVARKLETSYEHEMDFFEDNYCFALAPAVLWLAKGHRLRGEHALFLQAVCKFFRLCGYVAATVEAEEGVRFTPSEASWVPLQAVQLLVDAAYVLFFVQREWKRGRQMEKVARDLYLILNGVETGWVGLSDMARAG